MCFINKCMSVFVVVDLIASGFPPSYLCRLLKHNAQMNNEAITTTADHRASSAPVRLCVFVGVSLCAVVQCVRESLNRKDCVCPHTQYG